ncbi:MAG: cation transporter [Peptococcaceae bacterium]
MEEKILKVNKMSCNHCKMSVEKALQEIGVKGEVNLDTKTVTVNFDDEKISLKKIIAEIEDRGYEVEG